MKGARNIILRAAMELFAQKGYAACSLREICKAAGITKPVVYYHFRNKEHLYQELMLDIFNQTRKNLLRISKFRGPLRERLILYVSSEFRNSRRDPNSIRFLFRMMFSPEGEYPYFNYVEEFQRECDIIAGFIEEEGGWIGGPDPALISRALMGMTLVAVLEYLFTGRRTMTHRNAEKLVDMLLTPYFPPSKTKPKGKAGGRAL